MRSIINRRGSKAATRALKRLGMPQRRSSTKVLAAKPDCHTCVNTGWTTMDAVAACNCCEDGEFYTKAADAETNNN